MQPIEAVEQKRAVGILGASEAGAALGVDPHRRPIEVWRSLRGLPVNDERPDNVREAASWGQVLEPVVRGKYALERRVAVMVPEESIVAPCGWIKATPDGLVTPLDAQHGGDGYTVRMSDIPMAHDIATGLVQVKTCSREAWRHWGEHPPPHHTVQSLVEMAVCNLPWNDLAYLIGGQRMEIVRIDRDLEIEERTLEALRAFVLRVKDGVEPDVDDSDAWRQHASEKLSKGNNITIRTDEAPGLDELLDAWRMYRQVRKKYEADEARVKNEILLAMSAAGATAVDGGDRGRITAYQTGGRADWKGYAQALGGGAKVPERFSKPSNTWTLRAPKEWNDGDE